MERKYKYIINDKSDGRARLNLVDTTGEEVHDIKTDRGVWSEKETYAIGDQVIHGGSVWVAVSDNTASRPALGNTRWKYLGALDRSAMALVVTVFDTIDDGTEEKWSSGVSVRVFSDGHDISGELPAGGWVIRSLTPGLTVTYLNADHRTARLELTGQPDGAYIVQGEYTPLRLSSTATIIRLDIDGIISSKDLAKIEDAIKLIGDKDAEVKKRLEEAEAALRKEIEAEKAAREAAIRAEQEARDTAKRELTEALQNLSTTVDSNNDTQNRERETLTAQIVKAEQSLQDLQKQIDGEVSNWFYPGAPAPDKLPESDWTTNGLKARHIGDTYTSTDKSGQFMGKSWRYDTKYQWVEIADTLVSQALAEASRAQTTADGKSTTYLSKPTAYRNGDAWILESDTTVSGKVYPKGTILYATSDSSAFYESHWVDKSRYIGSEELVKSEAKSKSAWEAYAKAQAATAKAQAIADTDGKITAEEQARIKALEEQEERIKAYAVAQDELLKSQQEAYADGKVTEFERATLAKLEARAKLAETTANAYADGIVTAEEQARIDGDRKALEEAQRKVDELQIGGRNFILNSDFRRHTIKTAYANKLTYLQGNGIKIAPNENGNLIFNFGNIKSPAVDYIEDGTPMVFSICMRKENPSPVPFSSYFPTPYHLGSNVTYLDANKEVTDKYNVYRLSLNTDTNTLIDTHIYGTTVEPRYIKWMKLERGSKATDWTPAPEDVQAEIDEINAHQPQVNPTTKNWQIWDAKAGKYIDTEWSSVGDDGKAPRITSDGYWEEYDPATGAYKKTATKAVGEKGAPGEDAVVVTVEAIGEFIKRVTFNASNNTTTTTKLARGGVKLSDGTEVVRLIAKVTKGGTDVTESARTKGGLFKWYHNGSEITATAGKTQIDLNPATYADGNADAFELGVDTARAAEW